MTIDMRREAHRTFREFDRYQRVVGETCVWFRFDTEASRYDDIYDEYGRQYHAGVEMPMLWVDQIEDPEQYGAEGRRPTQRLRCAVSVRTLAERGIAPEEAHGNRSWDTYPSAPSPAQPGRPTAPWLDDRLNDIVYYDGRFWGVSNYQIRGRLQDQDVIVGVSAIELDPNDELPWDKFPWQLPVDFPDVGLLYGSVSDYGSDTYGGQEV